MRGILYQDIENQVKRKTKNVKILRKQTPVLLDDWSEIDKGTTSFTDYYWINLDKTT